MPTQHSKFFLDISCKDYSHPWTDSCVSTTAGLGLHAVQECFRIYTTVYVATLLMKGKIPGKNDIIKTILGILQSTAFLSWSGFSYSMFICLLRKILGNFHFYTVSFVPSFLSSFSAILIERPSRRPLLCLYVSNIATETLFRMGVSRGYFSPIPHGATYIFALSTTLLLYYYRSRTNKTDSIYKIIRLIIGQHEDAKVQNQVSEVQSVPCPKPSSKTSDKYKKQPHRKNLNILFKTLQAYKQLIEWVKDQGKHISCPHPHSCFHYVLIGAGRTFSYGVCAQLILKLVFQLRKMISKPQSIKGTIFRKENLNLAVFLGGFTGLYRLISCSLRRLCGQDSPYYAIPAGLIGSIAFMAYPDNTVALYFMWKALQLFWNDSVEKGLVPEVKWFVIFLYCFSTAMLFHAAIIEPTNLRSSYWKFLYNLSGGRIATMARKPLDAFGLETSRQLQEVLIKTNTTDQHVYSF